MEELWYNKNHPQEDDLHTTNQKTFGLPDRTTAKRFTFKMLYGGSDYGFSVDPLFNHVSRDIKFWKNIIDEFYGKYKGIKQWHDTLVREVLSSGQLVMPTGRVYEFDRRDVARRDWFWVPKIKNWPVQGTGADLVAIGRVTMWKRLRKAGIPVLFQSTVHDSVDIDIPPEVCYNSVCKVIKQSIEDIPLNFQRLFGIKFDLPVSVEIGYGPNLSELTPFTS